MKSLFALFFAVAAGLEVDLPCSSIESAYKTGTCCTSDSILVTKEIATEASTVSLDTPSNVVELHQADFESGTVRLREGGLYKLQEDILFEPNAYNDHWPDCGPTTWNTTQVDYCDGHLHFKAAYRLGFFAAITMEGSDIHVDLNAHSISQSNVHALQQRFYANIELADQPFIPTQGPAPSDAFGGNISSCSRCSVSNGRLGLSSHHGVHGNRANDIVLKDLVIENYEVAAISINGCQRVLIEDVHAAGQRRDVPARATYSAARFGQLVWRLTKEYAAVVAPDFFNSAAYADIEARSSALQLLMDAYFNTVIHGGPDYAAAEAAFGPTLVDGEAFVDGNAYGLSVHGDGVLVNQFGEVFSENSFGSEDITLKNVRIDNVLATVSEIVSFRGRRRFQTP